MTTGHFLEIYRGSILLRWLFWVFSVFWVFWAFPCVSLWIYYCFHDRRVEKIALPAGYELEWFLCLLCLLFWKPGWCCAIPPLLVLVILGKSSHRNARSCLATKIGGKKLEKEGTRTRRGREENIFRFKHHQITTPAPALLLPAHRTTK